jgi:DNA-binding response OmpR family regulator
MRYSVKAVHINAVAPESIGVLILSACEKTRASLLSIFAEGRFTVYEATKYQHAIALLRLQAPQVVITDDNWKDILDFSEMNPPRPSVIVTAPFADEALWADVLNRGGFDVLAQPFDAGEVVRTTQAAFRRSRLPNYDGPRLALEQAAAV